MPNTLTSFYLTEYETLLQPAPFPSKCISSWNQTKSKLTEILQLWRFPYSQKHCIYFCQLAKTYRECGGCMWRKFDKFDMMKQLSRMGTTNRTSLGQVRSKNMQTNIAGFFVDCAWWCMQKAESLGSLI